MGATTLRLQQVRQDAWVDRWSGPVTIETMAAIMKAIDSYKTEPWPQRVMNPNGGAPMENDAAKALHARIGLGD